MPVLVDFWAPWCGPCNMAAPAVAKAAANLAGDAIVLKVNTEEAPARCEVRCAQHSELCVVPGKLARERAGLPNVRVHDLRDTWGHRPRAAGVSYEDRQDLLGHKSDPITTHYSAPDIARLI